MVRASDLVNHGRRLDVGGSRIVARRIGIVFLLQRLTYDVLQIECRNIWQ